MHILLSILTKPPFMPQVKAIAVPTQAEVEQAAELLSQQVPHAFPGATLRSFHIEIPTGDDATLRELEAPPHVLS